MDLQLAELVQPEAELVEPEPEVPTLAEFASHFIEDYCVANRQKASTISGKRTTLRVHLLPLLGKKRLDEIGYYDVQWVKRALAKRSPSTVNNVLSLLSKMLKVAFEWRVIPVMPCAVKMVRRPPPGMNSLEFDEHYRLHKAAEKVGDSARLMILLGGDAGLRLGEMLALRWVDVDVDRRQIRVCRSDWHGHIDSPNGGRPRVVSMTDRLARELASQHHLRGELVLCGKRGRPLTDRRLQGFARRSARLANPDPRED